MFFFGTLILVVAIFPTTFLESKRTSLELVFSDPKLIQSGGDVLLMFLLPSVGGFGLGVLYLIPYSMVPDVVEYDELRTGERREGSYFSIFIFCEKLATGITLAFSNYLLGFIGFDASLGVNAQPTSAIIALRLLVGVLPSIVLVISWIACFLYPITKQKHAETLKQLLLLRDNKLVNKPY